MKERIRGNSKKGSDVLYPLGGHFMWTGKTASYAGRHERYACRVRLLGTFQLEICQNNVELDRWKSRKAVASLHTTVYFLRQALKITHNFNFLLRTRLQLVIF